MNECIFCRIINKEIPAQIIYEDERTLAFLDNAPITKGHTLVVPKQHSENLQDIAEQDLQACTRTLRLLSPQIKDALGADGYNIGNNNFPAAGQVVMHTHFHIIPRNDDDGLTTWPNRSTTAEELAAVQQAILSKIRK